jgi:hypothetical protein
MNMKATSILFALVSSLVCVLAAHADTITGGIAVGGSGAFTASSLQLNSPALVESSTGDLSTADSGSSATLYTTPLTGLSGTATTYSTPIASYFQLSAAGFPPSTGTSPADRFVFALTSITETNSTVGDYSGAGILTDTTGTYSPTMATFTLSNTGTPGGVSALSFTLTADGVAASVATPEPSVWALFAFGCGFLVFLRSSRRRA